MIFNGSIISPYLFKQLRLEYVWVILITLLSNTTAYASYSNNQQYIQNELNPQQFSEELKLAESIKTSDASQFKEIITKLKQHYNQFSVEQKNTFNFLYGFYLTYAGQYNSAEKFLKNIPENINVSSKAKVNNLLILIAVAKQDWGQGLQRIKDSISYLPQIKGSEDYQKSLIVIAQFYNQIKQYELSLKYLKQLSQLQLPNRTECVFKQLSLEARFRMKKLHIEDEDINDAILICENSNELIVTNIIRIYKSKLLIEKGRFEEALQILLPNYKTILNTHYPMLISEFSNTVASAYWYQNNLPATKIYVKKALDTNKELVNLLQGVDTYKLLFQIAKEEKRYKLALEYFERYAEIDKMKLEGNKTKFLAFQLAQHQAFEQESKIKLLNEKNALLIAEKSLEKSKVANIQLFIAILALVLIVLIVTIARLWESRNHIKALAEYDDLTGIYNRRHFTHITKSALTYCENAKQDLSLIMFDLDLFKTINDKYGHACGDWALKEVTKVCQHIGRQNDIFARVGGEEFFIVLPSCGIDEAMVRAEACRVAIEEIVTEESGHEFTITASFGVTDVKRSGFKLEQLMADADASAFISKRNGRNQISKFAPSET